MRDITNRPISMKTAAILLGTAGFLGWRAWRSRQENLRGRIVLVTGGSRGLGFLLAREFAAEGASVVICARDGEELARAAAELREHSATVLPIVCDVADQEQVENMVAAVTEQWGRIDIVVNNAGIIQVGPLESMSVEDFRRTLDIIFFGTLHTTLALLPQMRERRQGKIVNITSIGGTVAVPHLLPYDSAKFAQVGLSRGLRAELARSGIQVTTIVPGLMRTGSPIHALFKGDHDREFGWFWLGSATPLTAINAARAARRIVRATQRGEAEVTLSMQAKVLRLGNALFPGAMADLLGIVNRFLPAGTSRVEQKGFETGSFRRAPLKRRMANRNNELAAVTRGSTSG